MAQGRVPFSTCGQEYAKVCTTLCTCIGKVRIRLSV